MWKPLVFANALRKQWGTIVTSGALIGALGLWQGLGHHIPPAVYWTIALVSFLVASYGVWFVENNKYENEAAKNEAAPDIQVQLPMLIERGRMGSKTIHLFLNTILTLRSPRRVLLNSFQLTSVHNGKSVDAEMIDDVDQWERLLEHEYGITEHISLRALRKELGQRGDPIEGWLHFAIDSRESELQPAMLQLRVNSANGTCIGEIAGRNVFPNKKLGRMRRKDAAHEFCNSVRSTPA